MHATLLVILANVTHIPLLALLSWIAYRKFVSAKPFPALLAKPARVFKFFLFVALLGFAGCANTDPLATASGPVFALNAGHWQPSPQDLTVPPPIPNQ
jgi:hypothetical protein